MREHKATCFRYLLWAAVLFWAGLIFYMSAQNAGSSNAMSGGLLQRITALFPAFRRMAAEGQAQLLSLLHTLLRKAAHWSLYFVLGTLSALLLLCYPLSFRVRAPLVFGGSLLYALSDELHQYFVPGRSCELRDVLIDFCGAVIGTALTFLIASLLKKRRKASGAPK